MYIQYVHVGTRKKKHKTVSVTHWNFQNQSTEKVTEINIGSGILRQLKLIINISSTTASWLFLSFLSCFIFTLYRLYAIRTIQGCLFRYENNTVYYTRCKLAYRL